MKPSLQLYDQAFGGSTKWAQGIEQVFKQTFFGERVYFAVVPAF